MTLTGAGFNGETTVELVSSSGAAVYQALGVSLDTFTQITATFNLNGIPLGVYNVRVSRLVAWRRTSQCVYRNGGKSGEVGNTAHSSGSIRFPYFCDAVRRVYEHGK